MHTTQAAMEDTKRARLRAQVDAIWNSQERRKQPREAADIPARLKVINPILSTGPSARAQILNRSLSGLKLRTSHSLFVGALVQIRMPGEIVVGEVRYCFSYGTAFDVGIQVAESW